MKCPNCHSAMTLLFISYVCNTCNPPETGGAVAVVAAAPTKGYAFDRGYIVWRSRPPGSCEYVFKSRADAERWRAAAGLDRFPIRSVLSRTAFRWRRSTGAIRDVELADRLFEIFPDADHDPGPNRAFLD